MSIQYLWLVHNVLFGCVTTNHTFFVRDQYVVQHHLARVWKLILRKYHNEVRPARVDSFHHFSKFCYERSSCVYKLPWRQFNTILFLRHSPSVIIFAMKNTPVGITSLNNNTCCFFIYSMVANSRKHRDISDRDRHALLGDIIKLPENTRARKTYILIGRARA